MKTEKDVEIYYRGNNSATIVKGGSLYLGNGLLKRLKLEKTIHVEVAFERTSQSIILIPTTKSNDNAYRLISNPEGTGRIIHLVGFCRYFKIGCDTYREYEGSLNDKNHVYLIPKTNNG